MLRLWPNMYTLPPWDSYHVQLPPWESRNMYSSEVSKWWPESRAEQRDRPWRAACGEEQAVVSSRRGRAGSGDQQAGQSRQW